MEAASATAAMTWGVSSLLSSTKITWDAPTGNAAANRVTSGSIFSRSLRVGMTTLMSMECTIAPR